MNIKVVDVEVLSRHHSLYQQGIEKISNTKKDFLERLEPFKVQMHKMITESIKITDETIIKENAAKFEDLQEKAVQIDNEFKAKMREMNDELSKEIYNNLEIIISEWSIANDVDMVLSSTEVIYLNPRNFVTDEILEVLKEKELYSE
jgi:Skp family chaperone for outer membrane proteins